jgi:hypothetical protein
VDKLPAMLGSAAGWKTIFVAKYFAMISPGAVYVAFAIRPDA